tara:strand:+ start:243 stop:491 length:249 start_codon:yes stop_codon:yes gene_type:complete
MSSRVEISQRLTALLVDMFELDASQITLETNMYEDLDIDSIDAVDLVVRLNEWTGKKIAPEDFDSVRTIGDVVDAIERLTRS